MIVAFEVPVPAPGEVGAFLEFSERLGDFAIVAVGVRIQSDGDRIAQAAIACAGATSVPVRAEEAEAYLIGRTLADPGAVAAGRMLAGAHEAVSDIRASSDYRRNLMTELTRRAVETACRRAGSAG